MSRKTLSVVLSTALLVLSLGATADAAKHKTTIFANYSKGSTSGYVFGSLTSPFDNCKKRRSVTATYTSTTGELVSVSGKTDALGYFRLPKIETLPSVAAGPVTVKVKKKRVAPFDEKHICKKRSGTAIPIE